MNGVQGLPKSLKASVVVIAYLVVLVMFMLTVLFGAQLAFLIKLPRLSQLIHDWRSMVLVFSTFPELRFGLFFCMGYVIGQWVEGLSKKPFTAATVRERIKNMDRRHVVAVVGIAIFSLPLAMAAGTDALFSVALTVLCIVMGILVIRWVSSIGTPVIVTGALTALFIGFFGNLLMPSLSDQKFLCTRGFVELASGLRTPCDTITAFSDKPIWLIETAENARLIPRRDLQLEKALEARKPF